jgi:activator of HSP90 ATPase
MVESTGVGSIWNKNSWHWEERNYTELAKKWLHEHLAPIEVDSEKERVRVKIYEVKSVEGSATITIRKQKQIFLFEFKLELYFEAHDKDPTTTPEEAPESGEGSTKRMGRLIVDEFNQDDSDKDIDVSVVCETKGELTDRVRRALTSEAKREVLRVIGDLRGELQKIDASEEKIRRDAEERERALKDY